MDLPSLRHFQNVGIYCISSDPVEALHGEAWVPAIYTDKGWATADGSTLLTGIEAWRYGEEADQSRQKDQQSDERIQSGSIEERQAGTRKRSSRKKSQAGNSNCAI
jgi:hypothetical protein